MTDKAKLSTSEIFEINQMVKAHIKKKGVISIKKTYIKTDDNINEQLMLQILNNGQRIIALPIEKGFWFKTNEYNSLELDKEYILEDLI